MSFLLVSHLPGGRCLVKSFFLTLSSFPLAAGQKKGEKEIMHGNITCYLRCLLWPLHYTGITPNHSPWLPGCRQDYIGSSLVIKVTKSRKAAGYIKLDYNHKLIWNIVWNIIICIATPSIHYLVNSIPKLFSPDRSSI